jgi:hypothetical protein
MNQQDTITMVPVPNCAGAIRFIPSDRASDRIDKAWLQENSACASGWQWFNETFPNGCTYLELRAKLAEDKRKEWESWMCARKGGDVATAGDSGTATAGDSGTATAGYRGTATAGDRGTATAGYLGTATAGYRGTATAGDSGTATAGDSGTATAGLEGIIRIREWNEKQSRYRVVTGIIGENNIEANMPYVVVEGKLVKKPVESEA